jgi:hypothetical protein
MPTTKTRSPFFRQNLIQTFTGYYRLGNITAIQLRLEETDALRSVGIGMARPNVISKAFAYAKFFNRSHARSSVAEYKCRQATGARSLALQSRDDRTPARYDSSGMKKSIYLLAMLGLFAACEQKTTTVNPPADQKESNTTVVNPPSEKKETNTTVVNPPGSSTTTTKEKTDINVNTSPNP